MQLNHIKLKSYQEIDWRKCHETLQQMQERLVEEYRQKQDKNVKNIQRQIVTSFAARALAVRRVASNSGNKTPAVDGITWLNRLHIILKLATNYANNCQKPFVINKEKMLEPDVLKGASPVPRGGKFARIYLSRFMRGEVLNGGTCNLIRLYALTLRYLELSVLSKVIVIWLESLNSFAWS